VLTTAHLPLPLAVESKFAWKHHTDHSAIYDKNHATTTKHLANVELSEKQLNKFNEHVNGEFFFTFQSVFPGVQIRLNIMAQSSSNLMATNILSVPDAIYSTVLT